MSLNGNVKNKEVIPIFFACDDRFVIYTCVALKSLIENASRGHHYHVHVLCANLSQEKKEKLSRLATEQVEVFVDDMDTEFADLRGRLHVRDAYSVTTYYRLFIPDKFPQYDKVLYLDSDIIILRDIAKLYFTELGQHCVGAAHDQVMAQTELFGDYAEKVLGIDRNAYFNAGVLLINCAYFRKRKMMERFEKLLDTYTFVVAQDQDYLNVLCKDSVYWLEPGWNAQASRRLLCKKEDIAIIHYNLSDKPWHYREADLADYFWRYAEKTEDYGCLLHQLENYTKEERKKDILSGEKLCRLITSEIERKDNYRKLMEKKGAEPAGRRAVLDKIARYEREGRFDEDVEDDPPTIPLLPEDIDYLNKTWRERMRTRNAFGMARWFMHFLICKKQLMVKEIRGIENLRQLESGAVITCNHFSALDSFIIHMVYEESKQKNRNFYRVIREGNYTNFPGFYGYLMRNCNTLPLSSNYKTMKKFMTAVDTLLREGHFVLIYPEQSMWWNYRKPKPLKSGAYKFAAKSKVPVVPCFVTMQDTKRLDAEGFPIQEYTVHVSAPIWPDAGKSAAENAKEMRDKNYRIWKDIYEETYGVALVYEKFDTTP